MADFLWPSTNGSDEQHQPRVQRVRFGDGVEQRRPDGLNHQLRTWPRTIARVDPAIAGEIRAFLSARGGVESFTWVNDWDQEVRVVCDAWSVTPTRRGGVLSYTITATFREVVA
jgi:phage-related protein